MAPVVCGGKEREVKKGPACSVIRSRFIALKVQAPQGALIRIQCGDPVRCLQPAGSLLRPCSAKKSTSFRPLLFGL